MANIHILRKHALGLPEARKIAFKWAELAEKDFSMACTYQEGRVQDEVVFARSGVKGTLMITADKFELDATLGFLLGTFKGRIESEIVKNLDGLLAKHPPAAKTAATKKAVGSKVTSKK